MANEIKLGSTVRVKTHVPEGPVLRTRYDESSESIERLVSYTDAEGNEHERWFPDSELEWIADPAPEEEPEGEED